ncbi:MAG TPA: PilN domain-containing protein [Pirellulales bacterium]|jgi:hypothetical protein|nr:PilN domain-containing protein [Pirellulales bacterium]
MNPTSLFHLDFLPVHYREKKVQRQTNVWRASVVALVVGALATALVCQISLKYQAQRELKDLQPRYLGAQMATQHLKDLQHRLKLETEKAELYVYLQNPWPRTQLMAAVRAEMPSQVTLKELRITREAPPVTTVATPERPRPKSKTEEAADVAKLSPAARDLKKMREDFDRQLTVVALSGVATDEQQLRQYLKQLGQNDLFTKVEWGPVEQSDAEQSAGMKFAVRLTVRPGYDQLGGPQAAPEQAALEPAVAGDSNKPPANGALAQRGEP